MGPPLGVEGAGDDTIAGVYARAVAAGAEAVSEPAMMPWGHWWRFSAITRGMWWSCVRRWDEGARSEERGGGGN